MNQTLNLEQHFQNTKYEILKQKYEYMTLYLTQTQNRVNSLKSQNTTLRNKLDSQKYDEYNEKQSIQNILKQFQLEQRQKLKKIDQLKRLISQYKFLCIETIKYKQSSLNNSFQNKQTQRNSPVQTSFRENSYFTQLDNSQNQNMNNSSIGRNKSYQKIKTKIYCQKCQNQYKPNQYYRHFQQCHGISINNNISLNKSKIKVDKSLKSVGYSTMRN